MEKKSIFNWSIISTSILFAILFTIILGYLLGFRAYLVNGWSSEPEIPFQSLVIDYKVKFEDLHVGDYVTFSNDGKSFTTHTIVAKAGEGDHKDKQYFEANEVIQFENMGVIFNRHISRQCTIVTMTNNYKSYESFLRPYLDSGDSPETRTQVDTGNGPAAEYMNYSNVHGKVINILPKTGQFLIYIKNNFMQILVYVIIFYIATEFFKYVPLYIKLF